MKLIFCFLHMLAVSCWQTGSNENTFQREQIYLNTHKHNSMNVKERYYNLKRLLTNSTSALR